MFHELCDVTQIGIFMCVTLSSGQFSVIKTLILIFGGVRDLEPGKTVGS